MGGLSSFLAWSILSSTQEILGQSHHIEVTETIHATIHHLIREVDRAIIEGSLDRQFHMADLTIRVRGTIAAFLEEHLHEEEPFAEKEAEVTNIRTIQKLYHDLDAAANRTIARVAAKAPAGQEDLLLLDAVAHQIPALIQDLNEIHRAKIRRLTARGMTRMKVILGAYVAFLLAGGACVIVGVVLFSRTVALPLRGLASATLDIAAGDFGKRVPIGSRDEIGQLSYPETASATPQEVVGVPLSVSGRTRKQEWARLIKRVYEADPLLCPGCGGGMRILAFIEQPEVIEKILTQLPACAEGRQGPLAGPSAQPAGGVPVAVFSATGRRRVVPQHKLANGVVRPDLQSVTPP